MRRPRRRCIAPESPLAPALRTPPGAGASRLTAATSPAKRPARLRHATRVDPAPPAAVRSWQLVVRLEREARRLQQLRDAGLFRPQDMVLRAILADWRRLLDEELQRTPDATER